jgi:hypothetical protein
LENICARARQWAKQVPTDQTPDLQQQMQEKQLEYTFFGQLVPLGRNFFAPRLVSSEL